MADRRPQGRYAKPPSRRTRKQVRTMLVDDALAGVETPMDWMLAAYWYLGRGSSRGAEREFTSVAQEVRSRGGVMPGAPTMPRVLP